MSNGQVIMSTRSVINLEYDSDTREYHIVWEPVVIAAGRTRQEALEDLRTAAHFGIDTLVDMELTDTEKED